MTAWIVMKKPESCGEIAAVMMWGLPLLLTSICSLRDTHTGSRTICLHVDMNTCETHTLGPEQSVYMLTWTQCERHTGSRTICLHVDMNTCETNTLGPELSVYMSTWIQCDTHTLGPELSVYMSTWIHAAHTHWVQNYLFTCWHEYMRDTHTQSRTICLHVDMNTCETHILGPEQSVYMSTWIHARHTHWVQNNLFTCCHEHTHWVQNNLFTCRHEYMRDTHWVQNNLVTYRHKYMPISSSSDLEILLRMSNLSSSSFCEVAEHAYNIYMWAAHEG